MCQTEWPSAAQQRSTQPAGAPALAAPSTLGPEGDAPLSSRPHHPHAAALPLAVQQRTLTKSIGASATAAQLLRVWSTVQPAQINQIHVSAALCKAAKLTEPPSGRTAAAATPAAARVEGAAAQQQLLGLLEPQLEAWLPWFGPRAIANSLWALAKLGRLPPPALRAELLRRLDEEFIAMQPQEQSAALYALALWVRQAHVRLWVEREQGQQRQQPQWQQQPQRQQEQRQWRQWRQWRQRQQLDEEEEEGCGSYAISVAAHSGVEGDARAWACARPPNLDDCDALRAKALATLGLSHQRLQGYCRDMQPLLPSFGPQALSNTLYGLAVLGVAPPPGWLHAFWTASEARLPLFLPQQLSNCLWAAAKLATAGAPPPPPAWIASWVRASAAQLPGSSMHGISNMLWALAKLGLHPGHAWLLAALREGAGRLGTCSEQALANMCWALARMEQHLPRPTHLEQQHPDCHQQQQQQRAAAASEDAATGVGDAVPARCGTLATVAPGGGGGEVDLRQMLRRTGWLRALYEVSHVRFESYTPQQLANTIWALACLRQTPPPSWRARFFGATRASLSAMAPQELCNTLTALARLQLPPPLAWSEALEAAAVRSLHVWRPQHLASAAWASAQLPPQPPLLRLLRAVALESQGRLAQAGAAPAGLLQPLSAEAAAAAAAVGGTAEGAASAFTAQGMAMLAWALARRHHPSPAGAAAELAQAGGGEAPQPREEALQLPAAFWDLLTSAAAAALASAEPQALAVLLWSLARVGSRPHGAWVDAAVRSAAQRREGWTAQGCSMLLWALTRMELHPAPEPLLAIVERAGRLLVSCPTRNPQAAVTVLHALALLQFYPGSGWMVAWLEAAEEQLGTWAPRELAQGLWALSALQEPPPAEWAAAWRREWAAAQGRAEVAAEDRILVAAAVRQLRRLEAQRRRRQQGQAQRGRPCEAVPSGQGGGGADGAAALALLR